MFPHCLFNRETHSTFCTLVCVKPVHSWRVYSSRDTPEVPPAACSSNSIFEFIKFTCRRTFFQLLLSGLSLCTLFCWLDLLKEATCGTTFIWFIVCAISFDRGYFLFPRTASLL